MLIFELLSSYHSSYKLTGISVLDGDQYNLYLLDHPEQNCSQRQIQKVLKRICKGPSATFDLKLAAYTLKKNFKLDIDNCFDLISALSVFGKVAQDGMPSSKKIEIILNASLYKVPGLQNVPKSILEKHYKKRLYYIKNNMKCALNDLQRISAINAYRDHFSKISNTVGCLEASGFNVDTALRDELLTQESFEQHKQKLLSLEQITHPVYSIGTSTTGRLSPGSSYGIKFNALAIPKGKIRECVIPKNDILIEIDYTSFEIYVLLYLYAPEEIKDLFTKNDNIYDILSKETGIDNREVIKRIVFQKIYGQGKQMGDFQVKKLLSSAGVSEKSIYSFKKYFDWIDDVKDDIYNIVRQNNNTIINMFERRITFEDVSKDRKNLYFNNMIQMTAADIAFKTLMNIQNYLREFQSNLILFCHDSFVIDLCKKESGEVKNILQLAQDVIPGFQFPVKAYAGKNYNNMKQLKNAK